MEEVPAMHEVLALDLRDRYRGALLGLACGDALGTTLEFKRPGQFQPLTDMVGGGIFHLLPGQWTDDTSMALCLAESLIQCRDFDPADQMRRYSRWWREGYLSSTGHCFDIGNTTAAALGRFVANGDPYAGSLDPRTAGNGSLMRLAPLPLAYADLPEQAITLAAASSRTTHAAAEAVDACRYYAGLLLGALAGLSKQVLLSPRYCPVPELWTREPLTPAIDAVAAGSYKHKMPPAIRGLGYVVPALEAALWAFWHSQSFAEGALLAVNLGEDADTTGAIYGQLAGAWYGVAAIPEDWRTKLALAERIQALADSLLDLRQSLARGGGARPRSET